MSKLYYQMFPNINTYSRKYPIFAGATHTRAQGWVQKEGKGTVKEKAPHYLHHTANSPG
jgi:hypothetical protein